MLAEHRSLIHSVFNLLSFPVALKATGPVLNKYRIFLLMYCSCENIDHRFKSRRCCFYSCISLLKVTILCSVSQSRSLHLLHLLLVLLVCFLFFAEPSGSLVIACAQCSEWCKSTLDKKEHEHVTKLFHIIFHHQYISTDAIATNLLSFAVLQSLHGFIL